MYNTPERIVHHTGSTLLYTHMSDAIDKTRLDEFSQHRQAARFDSSDSSDDDDERNTQRKVRTKPSQHTASINTSIIYAITLFYPFQSLLLRCDHASCSYDGIDAFAELRKKQTWKSLKQLKQRIRSLRADLAHYHVTVDQGIVEGWQKVLRVLSISFKRLKSMYNNTLPVELVSWYNRARAFATSFDAEFPTASCERVRELATECTHMLVDETEAFEIYGLVHHPKLKLGESSETYLRKMIQVKTMYQRLDTINRRARGRVAVFDLTLLVSTIQANPVLDAFMQKLAVSNPQLRRAFSNPKPIFSSHRDADYVSACTSLDALLAEQTRLEVWSGGVFGVIEACNVYQKMDQVDQASCPTDVRLLVEQWCVYQKTCSAFAEVRKLRQSAEDRYVKQEQQTYGPGQMLRYTSRYEWSLKDTMSRIDYSNDALIIGAVHVLGLLFHKNHNLFDAFPDWQDDEEETMVLLLDDIQHEFNRIFIACPRSMWRQLFSAFVNPKPGVYNEWYTWAEYGQIDDNNNVIPLPPSPGDEPHVYISGLGAPVLHVTSTRSQQHSSRMGS